VSVSSMRWPSGISVQVEAQAEDGAGRCRGRPLVGDDCREHDMITRVGICGCPGQTRDDEVGLAGA